MAVLDSGTLKEKLLALPGWEYIDGQITKTYKADSFHRAVAFVVQVGMIADAADHHPDMDIRYNRVTLAMSTHSEGGITEKDIALSEHCERLL